MKDEGRGLALGAAAFGIWGLFPLYWPLLEPADATEILAHRVVWSVLFSTLLVGVMRRGQALREIWRVRRVRLAMTGAGVVIGFNWFTYIWGVNNGHVVETSLGYYINPLVTVLLGVVVLGERLRSWQWAALAIASSAVLVLSVGLGRPPWISLVLAFSFGTYGLLKKKATVGPVEGLAYEGAVLLPVAVAYLGWLSYVGTASGWSQGAGHVALLMTTGIVTVIPLLCFAGAANRISLSTIGLLQYIAPTLQFLLGVLVYEEDMPAERWIGFGLVWVALVILTADSLATLRRYRRGARIPAPPGGARTVGIRVARQAGSDQDA